MGTIKIPHGGEKLHKTGLARKAKERKSCPCAK
jgi:hypothetical protein